MAKTRRWFGIVRKKLFRSLPHHPETVIVLHTNNTTFSSEQQKQSLPPPLPTPPPSTTTTMTDDLSDIVAFNEITAAIKIQAYFRRHLAQRAYKALRSLVKLQAVVRGAYVRKQARIALECMHALARLQILVRARQLHHLTSNTNYSPLCDSLKV